MIWKFSPAKILQQLCPRLMCILTIQYHDGFLYFAAAVTLPAADTSESQDCTEYFVERVHVSTEILARSLEKFQDSALNESNGGTFSASTESIEDSQTKTCIETILLHLFDNFTYKWQQYALQEKIDSVTENRVCRDFQLQHLLLLVDPFLEYLPFETWNCVRNLFGTQVSRDYSLHIFVYRLLTHYDDSQQLSSRRTAAEMHMTFNKESVLTFENASSSERTTFSADASQKDERHKKMDGDGDKNGRKKITVAAGVMEEQGTTASLESSVSPLLQSLQTSTGDVTELLCTQAPQLLWTSHFERLRERGVAEDILIGLDLRHLCIAGVMDLHEHPGVVLPLRRRPSQPSLQRAVSTYCNIPLLLSLKGSRTHRMI